MKLIKWLCRVTGYEAKIRKHERETICYEIIHLAGWMTSSVETHNAYCILHKHLNKHHFPSTLPCHSIREEIEDYKIAGRRFETDYSQTIDNI